MRRYSIVLLLGVFMVWSANGLQAVAETINRIVAIVNDEVITEADVTASMKSLLAEQNPGDLPDDHAAQMQEAVLNRLIEQRLLLQEARRVG